MHTDTIAAIATAMAPSGIGIIRISGPDAFAIAEKIFVSKKEKKPVSELPSHTIHYGEIRAGGELIDEVLLSVMRAPHTYTREDVVEINTHGGLFVIQKVLELVIKSGARPAEPGEFTKRAFLNGRIDLTRAESVIDLINAKNSYALKNSVTHLTGVLAEKIISLRQTLLTEIARIESALDDPEHYSLEGYQEELKKIVLSVWEQTEHLIETADEGRLINEGIHTVIVGKPNAGKSSLLNALSGTESAIVTDIAGTTRDVLKEQVRLAGVNLNLIDTAGIRPTEDVVEKIGVGKSKSQLKEADLVLFVVDSATPFDDNDREILQMIREKKTIILYNKADLTPVITPEEIASLCDHPVIPVSMKDHTGIGQLKSTIREMFFAGGITFNDEVYLSNARQKHALEEAAAALKRVLDGIDAGMPEDFLTIDMMDAYIALGRMIGESVEDDLVDEIFSKFCMGK